jgi:hypothetical protein
MQRQLVKSSLIRSAGYDDQAHTLEIQFVNGTVYDYFDVPSETYLRLLNAPSLGQFFLNSIKDVYTYRRKTD